MTPSNLCRLDAALCKCVPLHECRAGKAVTPQGTAGEHYVSLMLSTAQTRAGVYSRPSQRSGRILFRNRGCHRFNGLTRPFESKGCTTTCQTPGSSFCIKVRNRVEDPSLHSMQLSMSWRFPGKATPVRTNSDECFVNQHPSWRAKHAPVLAPTTRRASARLLSFTRRKPTRSRHGAHLGFESCLAPAQWKADTPRGIAFETERTLPE